MRSLPIFCNAETRTLPIGSLTLPEHTIRAWEDVDPELFELVPMFVVRDGRRELVAVTVVQRPVPVNE